MDTSLLHHAAAQAKTGWLEQALTDLLPQVWDLTTESPGWEEIASRRKWSEQDRQKSKPITKSTRSTLAATTTTTGETIDQVITLEQPKYHITSNQARDGRKRCRSPLRQQEANTKRW